MIQLDYRDARPIYTQIMDGIRSEILDGILKPGEKLPSVRELAAELTINPNTIQRAYRSLEMEGYIVTVPGKGCFAAEAPTRKLMEQERQTRRFREAAAALLKLGMTPEALVDMIREEEQNHA